MNILVLNPGSSSLKSGFYRFPEEVSLPLVFPESSRPPTAADVIRSTDGSSIDAVGVRVVHGGPHFEIPSVVDETVLAEIRNLAALAPLHNPLAVAVIEKVLGTLRGTPIVAVFDTAFHRTLPPVAATYAVPPELGVRRYGFHGISYSYVSKRLYAHGAGPRLIVAHLGNGASICAIHDGRSLDTSMGFTPLEGLMMGTRAGDLDPGVLLYLLRSGKTEGELDDLLNHHCGLLGVSEKSSDVRELESATAAGNAKASLALDIFAYRVSKYIAGYCVALGGVDAIGFTAGIGEHSGAMRKRICDRLAFLGIELDDAANNSSQEGERRINSGRIAVWVVPTNEELEIARATFVSLAHVSMRPAIGAR